MSRSDAVSPFMGIKAGTASRFPTFLNRHCGIGSNIGNVALTGN